MFRTLILYVNFLFHYPIYSMIWCFLVYFAMLYWSNELVRSILLLYLVYILFDSSPRCGGWNESNKVREWARGAFPFRLMKELFDVELTRTFHEPLDTKRPYMFLYHPHGIIGMGCNIALTTNACGFNKIFPGINRSTCTLNASFLVPFFREWMLANGLISSNRDTILKQLQDGKSIVLVPGGASEALYTHQGEFTIVLKNRRGFLRLALITGCSIVPCLGFGENDLFHMLSRSHLQTNEPTPRSTFFRLQMSFKEMTSFSLPIATHVFPWRKKITVVVGNPIDIPLIKNPDDELIGDYNIMYCKEIEKLYYQNREKYGYGKVALTIL